MLKLAVTSSGIIQVACILQGEPSDLNFAVG